MTTKVFSLDFIFGRNDGPPNLERDLAHAIGFNRRVLKITGLWPDPEICYKTAPFHVKYKFLIPVFILSYFMVIPQMLDLAFCWGDMTATIENLSIVNVLDLTALLKTFTFRYYIDDIRPLVSVVIEDWKQAKEPRQRRVMLDSVRHTKLICIGCFWLTEFMVTLYFILQTYLNIRAGKDERHMFYRSWYPYDVQGSPMYEFMVIGQIMGIQCAIFTFDGMHNLMTILVFHACGQYVNLRYEIKHLTPENGEKVDLEEAWQKLTTIIRRHQHLIRFGTSIEEHFNKLLLFQVLVCVIQMCFQGYLIYMAAKGEGKQLHLFETIIMTFFLLFVMMHMLVYCYMGECILSEENSENIDLDYAIGPTRWFLKTTGFWPFPEMDHKDIPLSERLRFLIPTIITLLSLTIPQMLDLVVTWGNMERMIENLSKVNVMVTAALCEVLAFRYFIQDAKPLVQIFIDDWKAPKSDRQRKSMLKIAKFSNLIVIGCWGLTEFMVAMYYSLEIMINYWATVEERELFYPSYFPYDIHPTPVYQMTVLWQILGIQVMLAAYSGVHGLITILVMHTCGQLIILQDEIKNLVPEGVDVQMIYDKIWAKITFIVRRHVQLIGFVKAFEDHFNKMLLTQIFLSTLQMCFQGYLIYAAAMGEAVKYGTLHTISMIFFLLFVVVHIFIYCFLGEMLLNESTAFGYATYECNWNVLSRRHAKALLLIMTRARVPLLITAGKFCVLSIEFFGKILKTSFGYFSVLLTLVSQ